MKVSVWQQFSSNHSNSFQVVGVFESIEDAKKAQARIQQLLDEVTRWREANPEKIGISEPEAKIAEEFGLDWKDSHYFDNEQQKASLFDNIIEVTSPADSWVRKFPIEILLEKFGATSIAGWDVLSYESDSEEATIFKVTITCITPDEKTAKELVVGWQVTMDKYKGHVIQDKTKLTFKDLYFDMDEFQEIMRSFQQAKCTEIEFQLEREILDF